MSRATGTPVVYVAPQNDAFTVLSGVACLAVAVAIVIVVVRAQAIGVKLF